MSPYQYLNLSKITLILISAFVSIQMLLFTWFTEFQLMM